MWVLEKCYEYFTHSNDLPKGTNSGDPFYDVAYGINLRPGNGFLFFLEKIRDLKQMYEGQ